MKAQRFSLSWVLNRREERMSVGEEGKKRL